MDWRVASLGLLLDTVPCWWLIALSQTGLTWWNNGTLFVVPVIISCAVIITAIGLVKRGPPGIFSESDLIVLSAVIGGLVIVFGIIPASFGFISYSWHCIESGLHWFCDKANAINSLMWIWSTLLLAPAIGFFGAMLFAVRKRIGSRLVPETSRPGQAVES